MKTSMSIVLSVIFACLFAAPAPDSILQAVDENLRLQSDIKARVVMTQHKAGQGTKVIEMMYYRRDSDNSFLISMIAPEAEKGNGYLRVGDNFWMYRKNTRTFQHINRDESIGGTDASAEDFETRKLTELYEVITDSTGVPAISEETLGKIPVYKMELKARVHDVSYPRKTYWVRKDSYLPLKEQGYAGSGTLMNSSYYLNYTDVNGNFIPVRQMYIDEFEKGNKTLVEISGIDLSTVDDQIFTKAYLENISK